ncbi:MAG: hypothetical protein K8H90_07860 [Thermoanaerobaculia bacterium]|nr:hypothetical protein [Thermoanaerobaculia bacterium]
MNYRRPSRAAFSRARSRAGAATLIGVSSREAALLELDREAHLALGAVTSSLPLAFVDGGVDVLRVAFEHIAASAEPEISVEIWERHWSVAGEFELVGRAAYLPAHLGAELGAALRRVRVLVPRSSSESANGGAA